MTKFLRSFTYAFSGLAEAFRMEQNFRIHVFCSVLAVALAYLLEISVTEWLWIMLCISLMFMAELFNTAVESVVNLASPAYHEMARKAKDLSAAAVLIVALFAFFVGLIIFVPKFFN